MAEFADAAPAIEIHALVRASRWRERADDGRALVHEAGTLKGLGLVVQSSTGPWQLRFEASQVRGARAYDGQTSAGQPVRTTAQLRDDGAGLEVLHTIDPADPAASVGLRVIARRSLRTLPDVGSVLGFREDWRSLWIVPAARGRVDVGPVRWRWDVAAGLSVVSRLDLSLPGRDTATLQPRRSRLAELGLTGQWPLADEGRWSLLTGLRWRWTDHAASPVVPIYSAGLLRAGARQPDSQDIDAQFQIGLQRSFW
jgi:hypothetical protein